MKLLELFCGTKSISKVFVANGWNCTTIDNDPQFNPDICKDILSLDIIDRYDIVWASPPCTTYSIASVGKHWKNGSPSKDAIVGNKLLAKTFEIINLVRPKYWFIENPRGMMRKVPIMQHLPRYTVTYCQYGDTRMKPTDIWTNCMHWMPRPMCSNNSSCHESAPRGSRTGTQGLKGAKERSVIPHDLCMEIYNLVKDNI